MIFFALALLLAWVVGFVQGDHNFSASTGRLENMVEFTWEAFVTPRHGSAGQLVCEGAIMTWAT